MKNKSKQKGLTLVEFLVIAFILITISGIITGVVVSVLRGSSNSYNAVEASSNGNFALSVMSSLISSGTRVITVGENDIEDCTEQPSANSITIQTSDGGITTLACENETIASNSAPLIDPIQLRVPQETCSFTCRQESQFDKPVIQMQFEVEARNYDFETDQTSKTFQTSIDMRNYQF